MATTLDASASLLEQRPVAVQDVADALAIGHRLQGFSDAKHHLKRVEGLRARSSRPARVAGHARSDSRTWAVATREPPQARLLLLRRGQRCWKGRPVAVLAEKAGDSNALRTAIASIGGEAVIPSDRWRKIAIPHDPIA